MKLIITREQLKEIYDIACPTWQPKIEKYAQRTPFSPEIKFTEKEINEMVSASTAEQLPIVKSIFEVVDSWETIKSLEDAINMLGEKDEEVIQLRILQSLEISDRILAQQEATCFVRALNEKFVFDWKNSNEKKHRIWWWMDNFRFNSSIWDSVITYSPASLCFKNEKLSDYAGNNENYKNICKRFMY